MIFDVSKLALDLLCAVQVIGKLFLMSGIIPLLNVKS